MDRITTTITHYQGQLEKEKYGLQCVYNSGMLLPAKCRLVLHVSIPLISSDSTIKSASLEFDCYVHSSSRDIQDTVLSLISQIDELKIHYSEYEKSLLQKALTDVITKTVNSVKFEETQAVLPVEHEVLTTTSSVESFQFNHTMKTIMIEPGSLNMLPELNLVNYPNLVSVTVGENSLEKATCFMIEECPNIISITLGTHCLTNAIKCRMENCSNLRELVFPAFSFQGEGSELHISNCRSLEGLVFDPFSFEHFITIQIESLFYMRRLND